MKSRFWTIFCVAALCRTTPAQTTSPSLTTPAAAISAAPPPATTTLPSTPTPSLAAPQLPLPQIGPAGMLPAGSPSITLTEALNRARALDHNYLSALLDQANANADRTVARSAVLPNATYHNQGIYTQPQHPYIPDAKTGDTSVNPVFVANNTVREYVSQGIVTEAISPTKFADLQRANAAAAVARAKLEIARRGLVATVVADFYGLLSAEAKLQTTTRALDEAARFLTITQQLEAGGENSHADVLKARLTLEQRQRDLEDAHLAAEKARLDLGVLLFPDPMTSFTLAADLDHVPALPARAQLAASATTANPDIRAALAGLQAAQLEVRSNVFAYFPDLSIAYNYGIDADHFATREPNGVSNLGYAATATVDIPVWDWFATQARIRQSRIARDLARADLTATQRRALASFQEFYNEADVAQRQIASLNRSVEDAREALRLTDLRYAAGEGSVLEVLDAQNTLVATETARTEGTVRFYTALANLQTITGSLP